MRGPHREGDQRHDAIPALASTLEIRTGESREEDPGDASAMAALR